MKLYRKFKQTMAMVTVATTAITCMPVATFAADYDNHWAASTINEWKDKKIVEGYENGDFGPNKTITRAELAVILDRVFGFTETTGATTYKDVPVMQWFSEPIANMSAKKIMKDSGDNFEPDKKVTRQEAAYAIANAYGLSGSSYQEFTDEEEIEEWAEDQISALIAADGIKGRTDGSFDPTAPITRAEIITILDNITADIISKEGENQSETSLEGRVVVNKPGVVLQDMEIDGDLYIAEGVGQGDVTLNKVTVDGTVYVQGGGEHSIIFGEGTKADSVEVNKATGTVRIVAQKGADVGKVDIKSDAALKGEFNKVEVAATVAKVALQDGTTVKQIDVAKPVEGESTVKEVKLDIAKDAKVSNVTGNTDSVKTTGNGKVDKVNNKTTEKPSTGGGGGGGSSSGGSSSHKKPFFTFDNKGINIAQILVTGDGVTNDDVELTNLMTVSNDAVTLDITKATDLQLSNAYLQGFDVAGTRSAVVKGNSLLKNENYTLPDIAIDTENEMVNGKVQCIITFNELCNEFQDSQGNTPFSITNMEEKGWLDSEQYFMCAEDDPNKEYGISLLGIKRILTSDNAAASASRGLLESNFNAKIGNGVCEITGVATGSSIKDTQVKFIIKY